MDYVVYRISPGGVRSKAGVWHGGPDKGSELWAPAFASWVTANEGKLAGRYGYEAEPLSGDNRGRGRPRSPLSPLEQVFTNRGITRSDISQATGYSARYVASVLRGTEPVNPRFVGAVVHEWPRLAEDLVCEVRKLEAAGA